jgi:hypothetical protein
MLEIPGSGFRINTRENGLRVRLTRIAYAAANGNAKMRVHGRDPRPGLYRASAANAFQAARESM